MVWDKTFKSSVAEVTSSRDCSNVQYAQSVFYHLLETVYKTSEYCYSVFGPLA